MLGSVWRGAGAVALALSVAGGTVGCTAAVEHLPPAHRPSARHTAGAQAPAAHSVVKVRGFASSCGRRTEATGFVYAPERVLLNAHTVAGVDRDLEVVLDDGRRFPAQVVAFDPEVDAAVLRAPGLTARPLRLTRGRRTTAVVVGYRKGEAAPAVLPATVRPDQPAESYDIYNRKRVSRQVHPFQGAAVTPGMSGAPLITGGDRAMGMVFAVDMDRADVGYALTAAEIEAVAVAGEKVTTAVPHEPCS
ncbi:trypsin-like peptidase domain-containing protein [Microbispora sp. NEAU-D428]|uniref:trypsin-like peptidase domain-containing protein n=1 Tax=Microbispora sitophila TaxID=2771537 RepID=UPI0018694164|nr:trypsin-like peptidase domain-containing protein [Microbispora sitophila]MBE3009254.1 trypsin-like peptidase domain-containing protein [Microbispora sitophila]